MEPKRFDFRSASLLTAAELRRARRKHEQFARALATRLSIHLRVEFEVQVGALQTLPQPRFLDSLPNPSHLTLFELEPLRGAGLLAVPLPLSVALLDRLLGGPGQPVEVERGLTDLEVALLDQLAQTALKEWAQAVAGLAEARAEILTHETHPRFLPPAPAGTQVLAVTLEASFCAQSGQMHLAFPFSMVEPLLRGPELARPVRPPAPEPAAPPALRWLPALGEVPVQLTACWEGLQITARQLAQLKVGDVLPLAPQRFEQVQVRLARVAKFVGRLGASRQVRAVELTAPLAKPSGPFA